MRGVGRYTFQVFNLLSGSLLCVYNRRLNGAEVQDRGLVYKINVQQRQIIQAVCLVFRLWVVD